MGREEQGTKRSNFHVVDCNGQRSGAGAKVSGEDVIDIRNRRGANLGRKTLCKKARAVWLIK